MLSQKEIQGLINTKVKRADTIYGQIGLNGITMTGILNDDYNEILKLFSELGEISKTILTLKEVLEGYE